MKRILIIVISCFYNSLCNGAYSNASFQQRILYSFATVDIPIYSTDHHAHPDPFLLDLHHTRYYGGCFSEMSEPSYKYQTIVPWIHNFDIIITGCRLNWLKPLKMDHDSTCAWKFDNNDYQHHHHRRKNESYTERVHVHSDRQHHDFFRSNILRSYESRFDETGEGIILHSGGKSFYRMHICSIDSYIDNYT